MINFLNDYSLTACPEIMEVLNNSVNEKYPGYLNDRHTKNAIKLIRERVRDNTAEVQFLMAGTQTNLIAISAFLRPHEAVITPATGHINVHETGAIEATGHKCIAIDTADGKLYPEHIINQMEKDSWSNAGILEVKPKLVYISQTTELGTAYSKTEIIALKEVCEKYGLYLFVDGARLASGIACTDADLEVYGKYTDAFYIGGNKNGALFGEALVILNDKLKEDIGYISKQRGGILAKGWILGIQFERMFQDDLYERNGRKANEMSDLLRDGLSKLGAKFYTESYSNQTFVLVSKDIYSGIKEKVIFETVNVVDDNFVIRLVTSWATTKKEVEEFIKVYKDIVNNLQ